MNNFKEIESILLSDKLSVNELYENYELSKIIHSTYFVSPDFMSNILSKKIMQQKEIETLNKYFLRMISRSTPFGNMVTIKKDNLPKKDIVEMNDAWYCELLKTLLVENTKFLLNETTIVKSSNSIKINDEYIYIFINDYKNNRMKIVRSNKVINYIWDKVDIHGTSTDVLCDTLCGIFKMKQHDIIKLIIKMDEMDLIDIVFTGNDSQMLNFQSLKMQCRKNKEKTVINCFELINYDLSKNEYSNLVNLIKKINVHSSSTNNFNLKSFGSLMESNIPEKYILEFFSKISEIGMHMPEKKYKSSTINFILEEYGRNIKVPINRILLEKNQINSYQREQELEEFIETIEQESECLFRQMHYYGQHDLKEIKFFDNILAKVEKFPRKGSIFGCDIVFECLSDSRGKIKSPLSLSEEGLTNYPGKMLGRFSDSLEKNGDFSYKEFVKSELVIDESSELVEIFSGHEDKTVYNILPKKSYVNNVLTFGYPINAKKYLDINKLFIYVDDNNNLGLYSEELGKKVKLVNFNMFNPELSNIMYESLYNLFFDSRHLSVLNCIKDVYIRLGKKEPISFGELEIFKYQYKIPSSIKKVFSEKNLVFEYILSQLEEKEITSIDNKLVFYYSNYNKILVNLENPIHRNIIYKDMDKSNSIKFSEIPESYLGVINHEYKENLYHGEVVLSIGSSQIDTSKADLKRYYSEFATGVLSITIYQQNYLHNPLLIELLQKLFSLKEEELISNFFYIRYIDEHKDSIRLRVIVNKKEKSYNLKKIVDYLTESKLVSDFKVNRYLPEIERYGGLKNRKNAQDVFCTESLIVLEKLMENTDNTELDCFAIFLTMNLLSIFDLESNFKNDVNNYRSEMDIKIRKKYRKDKLQYKHLIFEINKSIKQQSNFLSYVKAIKKLKNGLIGEPHQYEIVSSLIHIMCNRIFGVRPNKERKIRIYSNNLILNNKFDKLF